MRDFRQRHGAKRAEQNADHPPDQAQHERFDQELEQDIESGGAERLAHADLARPLGYRHQHDVHDADAAHQQAHGRDAREQVREGFGRLLECGENV